MGLIQKTKKPTTSSAKAKKVEASPVKANKNTKKEEIQERLKKSAKQLAGDKTEFKDEEMEVITSSSIEQILDPNNTEPIILFGYDNAVMEFQQVALVPYNDEVYVILRPIKGVDGLSENDAVVFVILQDDETFEFYLDVVVDTEIVDNVFKLYQDLFKNAEAKAGKNKPEDSDEK